MAIHHLLQFSIDTLQLIIGKFKEMTTAGLHSKYPLISYATPVFYNTTSFGAHVTNSA